VFHRHPSYTAWIAVLVLSILGACGSYDLAPVKALRADHDEFIVDFGTRKLDVLFVVDSSGSMENEQANLANSFPKFIQNFAGKPIDFHLGVITTDINPRVGQWYPAAEQGGSPYPGRQLFSSVFWWDGPGSLLVKKESHPGVSDAALIPKYLSSSDMTDEFIMQRFVRDVRPGIDGSGNEAPLLAVTQFLSAARKAGWNNGFLRSDSLFSVVIVSDEDESRTICDPDSIDPYVSSDTCEGTNGLLPESYVSTFEAAKKARLDLFNSTFRAQRPKRPSLLNVDAVVALGMCGGDAKTNGVGVKAHGALFREVAEAYKTSSTDDRVHDICQSDFSNDIGKIGNVLANSVERVFELNSDRVIGDSVLVEINGFDLSPSQYSYNASTNQVTITDFGFEASMMSGKVTIRIYYDKRIQF
jgi:hypothetical protein